MMIDSANRSFRDLCLPGESQELTDLLILLFSEVMGEAIEYPFLTKAVLQAPTESCSQ